MSDEFDRSLLEEALPAHEPPASFADRVVAAVDVPRAAPHLGRTVAIAAACVAATVAVFLMLERNGTQRLGGSGSLQTSARQEVLLGGRGTAVAEPGAELSWNVERSGDARIEQP